jgi:SAM-dependent methyltransferase
MTRAPTHTTRPDLDELAATANRAAYDSGLLADVGGAPHVRHASLRRLYGSLAAEVFDRARSYAEVPGILDLGAGDGAVTTTFLTFGASVTAVDVSARELAVLAERHAAFAERLRIEQGDALRVLDALRLRGERFDIVTGVSFLHHIPNYLAVVAAAIEVLEPHGQVFVFQDPLRRDSVTLRDRALSRLTYAMWRMRQPDTFGGLRRHLRRRRGVSLPDCEADMVEYHELRQGVDEDAILRLLRERHFDARLVTYFSTQSPLWQAIGERLGARNKFAIVAMRGVARG